MAPFTLARDAGVSEEPADGVFRVKFRFIVVYL